MFENTLYRLVKTYRIILFVLKHVTHILDFFLLFGSLVNISFSYYRTLTKYDVNVWSANRLII